METDWPVFSRTLELVEVGIRNPNDGYAEWAYLYGSVRAWGLMEARLPNPTESLKALRKYVVANGISTEVMTRNDWVFVASKVQAMDTRAALDRVELVLEAGCSTHDPYLPRILREAADVARVEEHWGQSAEYLVAGQIELERLLKANNSEVEETTNALLECGLDLAASEFLLEFERGQPEGLAVRLEAYRALAEDAWERDPVDGGYRIADGYFFEMRYWDALGRHESVRKTFAEGQEDQRLTALRESEPEAIELLRLACRDRRAGATLARVARVPQELRDSLAEIQTVIQRVPPTSREAVWLKITQATLHNDLRDYGEALAVLSALRTLHPADSSFKEVNQAIAVQSARSSLGTARSPEDVDVALIALEETWNRLVQDWSAELRSRQGAGVLWFPEERDVLETLMRLQTKRFGPDEGALKALEAWLTLQCQGSLYRALGGEPSTLGEVLPPLMASGQGIVAYFPGREALHVFSIDEHGAARHEVDVSEPERARVLLNFTNAIGAIRTAADVKSDGDLQDARKEASQLLLPAPLLERMRAWNASLVVGLESVGYAPFGYLLGSDGKPVGVAMALSHCASLPLAARLADSLPSRNAPHPPHVLQLASHAPAEQTGHAQLKFGEAQRERLAAGLDPEAVTWIAGKSATRAALEEIQYVESQAWFLLAHGDTRGDEPRLVLAGGESLDPASLEALQLPSLVVLDACGAGRSLIRRGDDGRHRWEGAAFLGGAQVAALSVLDVDYEATLDLRARVQAGIFARGERIRDAWRQARETLWQDPPEGVHPVEFFLHDLHGNGALRLTPHPQQANQGAQWKSVPWPWVGAGLLLAAATWLALRRRNGKERSPLPL